MDFNEVELTVGDNNVDCNEVLKAGESATQDPKAHVLKIENKGFNFWIFIFLIIHLHKIKIFLNIYC
jgi:hypothetical protein